MKGNQPGENHQAYSSSETWSQFARLTQIHLALVNYTRDAVYQNSIEGIPVMRPLFLHYENDPGCFTERAYYQYLYGRELLVAPVVQNNTVIEIMIT